MAEIVCVCDVMCVWYVFVECGGCVCVRVCVLGQRVREQNQGAQLAST